ncbi:energy transducer TonB [Qipengyuania sphaerica]|uniref:energy transducer TonB n=1 Tax=Qipengyuania sphaerica TaxID=2867243 RepID=UPI001C881F11|nr:energy transducer TonB [Qipengyuania sphaerica]MBX7539626.1 energy transducer TonB [Qipengyuania sphaerica]
MERAGIRAEEKTGLIVAVALHVALLAVLVIRAFFEPPAAKPVERMTVNLTEDVGLEATAPDPVPESRAAIAPELSDVPAPAPEILEAPSRPVVERPTPRQNTPRRETPREQPKAQPTEKPKGSRIGDNFLTGSGGSTSTNETRTPASQIGSSAKASLFQAVGRQLRPHWTPPSGPEVEQIVTKVRFRLNPDGTLNGRPSVVGQRGVNDTNRAQASRHGEQAVRAVQLAAPFDLPAEYYEAWKLITVDFDWKLSQ